MFTATLTVSDLDFAKPEDAAVALLAVAGTARPLSVALFNQHTDAKHLVTVEDFAATPEMHSDGLSRVISFLEGFEGDETQEGIPELLAAAHKADSLLHRNLNAWEDEEDTVQEEHHELIDELRNFLEGD
ncbi:MULTISPECIES: hypothetical protein [Agrobacterium]|uniref:hypothetical protein n=1 Tax=Agrobacterium TaxID=357 RepID=UPI0022FFD4D9|nr:MULTISPECIES: hypothetical protein [Agrobacterium]MDA5627810.1 hypothetical protein [Agrobacterium sp. ST15.16.055]MDA6978443.1 hypothetical protein [Agrobacterium salinitolerans]